MDRQHMSPIPDTTIPFIMYMNMITDIVGAMSNHIGNIQTGVMIIAALGILVMGAMKSGAIGIILVVGNMK